MNGYQREIDRLYGLGTGAPNPDAQPGSRALVLSVALPASWQQLSSVWQGVQADLELPAPAIALSGVDSLQLWFSFASPIAPSSGADFARGLRARYLADVPPARVGMFVGPQALPAAPGAEGGRERWSAFVSHDLASLFAETPWLDLPPNEEGQATLLRTLEPTSTVAFQRALASLAVTGEPVARESAGPAVPATEVAAPGAADPARFLAGVMNDATAPLALRIEAARILLLDARTS